MERFFGGKPAAVLFRLVVLSIVVGIVLAALNLDAFALIESLKALARRIYEMGFDAIEWAFEYFFLGAVIVFPVWLIARLLKTLGGSTRERGSSREG